MPVTPDEPAAKPKPATLVDHDGRIYRLADLLGQLTPAERAVIESIAPATAQAAWDEAVRRWPALTADADGRDRGGVQGGRVRAIASARA